MEDFEERYSKYVAKLKNEIPYALGKAHHDFEYNFEHDSVSDSSVIGILWFVCFAIGNSVTEHKVIPHIVFAIVWIGIGIFFWIFIPKHKKAVSDYFFSQYEYKKIIEDRIKRDEQREIQNLLNEMFKKDKLNIDDLDVYLEVYQLKLEDIKDFYDRCLMEIKYEYFEEKIK